VKSQFHSFTLEQMAVVTLTGDAGHRTGPARNRIFVNEIEIHFHLGDRRALSFAPLPFFLPIGGRAVPGAGH
jgi:hypothetical protein